VVSGGSPVRGRGRAVVLVPNAAAPYSRGLRVARSLDAAGFDVEIAAVAAAGLPEREEDGRILIRRYRPRGPWAGWDAEAGGRPAWVRRLGPLGRAVDRAVKLVAWPAGIRGWWAALRHELPPADLYHVCGILGIGVAVGLARDARARGRAGRVVYDVIDVILESNNYAAVPRPVVAWYQRREHGWVRRADAVVTVNDAIADHLAATWPLATRPTVLLNCQPGWTPPEPRPDRIREAAGIPPDRRIVLFLGRVGRERGLDEAAEAVRRVDDAALVLLGFGPWADRLRARAAEHAWAGRLFVLPPVHPDYVPEWTASADATIVAVPANSLNQRLSSPNKFWESLTAGTPIVVGRDLEVMRAIVEAEGIGAVADPADPDDLARALRAVLDQDPAASAAMRGRALSAARERYRWETAVVGYLALVDRLVPPIRP
jgi:glycosyltransferase involved in cell wall biosynthesis